MQIFQIEKPDIGKYLPKKQPEIDLKARLTNARVIARIALEYEEYKALAFTPEYLYWDKFKYRVPEEIKHKEEFWIAVKEFRREASSETPIKNESGKFFTWVRLPYFDEFFHLIDKYFAGKFEIAQLAQGPVSIDTKTKNKYKFRGILDESIASSQIEGANTTRKLAKELINTGRKPKNKSEQMIFNNYQAMNLIDEEYKDKALSKAILLEIHEILAKSTIPQKDIGRFRDDEDEIVVSKDSDTIFFKPPGKDFLEKELDRLIDFANDAGNEQFIHPVVKAIMLHFWIGYLHPFCDGNGRLARVLFYWYLIKKDYWAFTFMSFSSMILKTRTQYEKAYLYSEQDDNDLTYFIDYNIRKIDSSLKDFLDKFEKNNKKRELKDDMSMKLGLNSRQVELLEHFLEHPKERTTPTIHRNTHQVSKLTAINDLKELTEKGYTFALKHGKNKYYYPSPDLKEKLNK